MRFFAGARRRYRTAEPSPDEELARRVAALEREAAQNRDRAGRLHDDFRSVAGEGGA